MMTQRVRNWKSVIVALLAGGSVVTGSTVALADDFDPRDYWSLPGIPCDELYVPSGGEIVYEDTGYSWSHCSYDTPRGVVTYFWDFVDLWGGSAESWNVVTDEEGLEFSYSFQPSPESFGTYLEAPTDQREWAVYVSERTDTGSQRWGAHRDGGVWYVGPPEAISQMKDRLAERIGQLLEALRVMEDPASNQEFWDMDAPDCADLWDGSGLEPGLEVATTTRTREYVSCVVIPEGANPFARDLQPLAYFGYTLFDCRFGAEDLLQSVQFYPFQQEESFGLFYFDQGYQPITVPGERTNLVGVYADVDDCALYNGWPEVITRMVDYRNSSAGGDGANTSGAMTAGSEPAEPLVYAPQPAVSATSLFGAVSAVALVGILLLLRRFLTPGKNSSSNTNAPTTATTESTKRLGARMTFVVLSGVVALIALVIADPIVRNQFQTGVIDLTVFGQSLSHWGIPVAMATALGGVIVAGHSAPGRLVQPRFFLVSGLVVVATLVVTVWPLVVSPLIPLIALMASFAVFGSTTHKRQTLLVWWGTILSSLLFALGGTPLLGDVLPEWGQQVLLITLGLIASSTVVATLPIGQSPGATVYQTSPLMWAGAMAVSWWIVITLTGLGWLFIAIASVAALIAVLATANRTVSGKQKNQTGDEKSTLDVTSSTAVPAETVENDPPPSPSGTFSPDTRP
jgi:hypothetical protein